MQQKYTKLELLNEKFCFSKLPQFAEIPSVFLKGEFCFIARTDVELVVVSPEFMAPNNVQQELGFRCFRLYNTIPLDEHRVVASIVQLLASGNVNVQSISTFDTVYVFFREDDLETVVNILQKAGYEFVSA
ncbi:MAG: ACT domain-containing protein [Bacteroidetes bacterium]|nr:ACT domain-containing protein [Bacteroidota bacterium]